MTTYAARLKDLEKRIIQCDRELKTVRGKEAQAREAWTKKFHLYIGRSKVYRNLKNITTIKAKKLRNLMDWWDDHGWEFTKKRDEARAMMVNIAKEKTELDAQKRELIARVESEIKVTDEIIEQILILFAKAHQAHRELEQYLLNHLKRRLIRPDGRLHSQISLTHSNGRDRVVAYVRSINKIASDKAEEALILIETYNNRTLPSIDIDETTRKWRDLIKGLLIQKIKFAMGDRLGQFLGTEISEEEAPELKAAQRLLMASLTSEKSEPCVRVYKRENSISPFKPVPFK